ncbi:EscU/YscU/HrcU family type III secretion system export apparatus switch protein [Natronincola ferrireducens]|uniref:Flagellar biosynthesis protein n=1 Tax=Natronincola ferrireducens TaxID=393762 RepID=A0A1G8XTZ2_9FIRM|nr:EscU/YscU/HrcU family type III secretion system export apparatus switch protein [Natronincola ferrireducens]SDJ93250.1 flagellar biosynthesis protein [Natronincola ferrireducens]
MKEVEKRKQAVALKYDIEKDHAPKIIAMGQGVVAENILKLAEENQVVVQQDDRLVKQLLEFSVGTEIPPELYEVVAQILAFVEMVDKEKGLKQNN